MIGEPSDVKSAYEENETNFMEVTDIHIYICKKENPSTYLALL